jgi:hypothetical protein
MTTSKTGTTVQKPRGFAAMDPERHRRISQMGGAAVPADKRTFSYNKELAVASGRKGGRSVAGFKRSFSQNRKLAAEAGRKGASRRTSDSATPGSSRITHGALRDA